VNEHDTQVMWLHSASQDLMCEPEEQVNTNRGYTALRFAKDEVNKIIRQCEKRFNWKPNTIGSCWITTTVQDPRLVHCECGSKLPFYWLHDGHGIPLCKVCDKCKPLKLRRYRTDIMSAYQADEPIDDNE
jgi:hypothetical protein